MLRNLPWKVVKSIHIGGGRASLVARRYRRKHTSYIPKDRTHYAVIWEGNHQEGFPALLAGGWSGDKKQCEDLFEEIRKCAQAFLRQTRSWMNNTHGKTPQELERNSRAQAECFALLSDASLEMQQRTLTLADLRNVEIVEK